MFTLICFGMVIFCLYFSDFDPSRAHSATSLLSYFFFSNSIHDTYCLADITPIIFLFLVTLFSVSLLKNSSEDGEEFKITLVIKGLGMNEWFYSIFVLVACVVIDYLLFQTDRLVSSSLGDKDLVRWIHDLLMYPVRQFLPWFLFVYALYKSHWNRKFHFSLKALGFAFLAYLIIRAFTIEFYDFVKIYLMNLIFLHVNVEKKFFFESLLGTGIITSLFLGYYAVMTSVSKMLAGVKLSGEVKPES